MDSEPPRVCCCALGSSCISPDIGGTWGGGPMGSVGRVPERTFLIVGQNPGADEDTQGVPFVGKSGRLLRGMLADAGYKPEDWYVTNAVRCHTPRNRPPTPDEVAACRPRLREEIQRVRPTGIIALGDVALRSLCGPRALSSARGGSVPLHNFFGYECPVWPTYHPAYVVRVPQVRTTVVTDLTRARTAGAEHEAIPWRISSGNDLLRGVPHEERSGTVAYDIETDYWFTGGDIVIQAAVASGEGPVVVVRDGGDVSNTLRRLTRGPRTVVSHNGWAFDDPRTGVKSDYDTMALAYVDDESQPLGLEPLCVKYLGIPGWKEDAKGSVTPDSDSFALYNARDAFYTLSLYHKLRESLGARIVIVDRILRPAWYALEACRKRGVFISSSAVETARAAFEERVLASGTRIRGITGDPLLNPNSPAHVGRALLAEGHVLPLTATGKPATGAGVLSGLRATSLVAAIVDHRESAKAISAFVRPYRRAADSADGRVHPTYTLFRTATGRTSARALNIQQVSRDPLIYNFLSAPHGYELMSVDYAAIEFRVAAWVAGERGVIERYSNDPAWDPHRYFASKLYRISEDQVTKDQRQVAKSGNFSLLFMGQPPTLLEYARKMGVSLTIEESRFIHKTWHETFPAFRSWYGRVASELRVLGYIETFTGRRRHFGDPSLLKGSKFNEALREAVNTHVQGPSADIALLGLSRCHDSLLPICAFVHDDIKFEFPAGEGMSALPEITWCMTQGPVETLREHFGVDFDMPLLVEAKVRHAD